MSTSTPTLSSQPASREHVATFRDLWAAMPIVIFARAVASAFADSGRARPGRGIGAVRAA